MADKILLKIGTTDLTSYINSYKIDYNVLTKGNSRNAAGNAITNILNRKVTINVGFIPMSEAAMATILGLTSTYEVAATFWDVKTQTQISKTMLVDSPSPDFYSNGNQTGVFKDLSLTLIEV
jgi:hypothetical protein